jgi:hypothetical protein
MQPVLRWTPHSMDVAHAVVLEFTGLKRQSLVERHIAA